MGAGVRRVRQQTIVHCIVQSFKFELLSVNARINGKELSNLSDRSVSIQFSLLLEVVVRLMGLTNAQGIAIIFHASSACF